MKCFKALYATLRTHAPEAGLLGEARALGLVLLGGHVQAVGLLAVLVRLQEPHAVGRSVSRGDDSPALIVHELTWKDGA